MKRIILHLIFFFSLYVVTTPSPATSQSARPANLVLMSVSAHPDDEDGATLAYYAKLRGVKTYTLFLTRGEGGQNEIGPQLYEELGAIRTNEALNASAILGSESYFMGFPDFGYSRTAGETFEKWGGRDSVVAHLVYFIRALKPDVIITTHDTVTTKPYRQHGNHQATGISIFEAFQKAADPKYHPEQLNGDVTAWQARKLFFRFFLRDSLTRKGTLVTIDTRGANHDKTVDSIALASLRQHHSQGMGNWTLDSIPAYYRVHTYYAVRESGHTPFDPADFFTGITPEVRRPAVISSFPNKILMHVEPARAADVQATLAPDIHIAIVTSYDNTIPELFDAFHVGFTPLDSAKLATSDLSRYSVIILDLRAYHYRPDLVRYNGRLLAYIRNGGNVVAFYQKSGDWNGFNFAPFPITLTSERVTEENSRVKILNPMHPFFTTPNIVTDADWDGWIQERSIYLPSADTAQTSSSYERLLAMSDTGEDQPPTSLLWARVGKGTYTYCSLTLYRQLRLRHEGAVRLLFNMLSQP